MNWHRDPRAQGTSELLSQPCGFPMKLQLRSANRSVLEMLSIIFVLVSTNPHGQGSRHLRPPWLHSSPRPGITAMATRFSGQGVLRRAVSHMGWRPYTWSPKTSGGALTGGGGIGSTAHSLKDLGQVTQPLCDSTSSLRPRSACSFWSCIAG